MIIKTSDFQNKLDFYQYAKNTITNAKIENSSKVNEMVFHYTDSKITKRLGLTAQKQLIVMRKGSKKYGHAFWLDDLDNYNDRNYQNLIMIEIPEKKEKDESLVWSKSWNTVLTKLEKSGLWLNIQDEIRLVLEIGYEKMNKVYNMDNEAYTVGQKNNWNYDQKQEYVITEIEKIDARLISINDQNQKYVKNDITNWMGRPAKIKKMNFGYSTERVFQEIKEAMEKKVDYDSGRITVNYDNSFSYRPEPVARAWYSEEFKNCGNGHYYLAIDGTHAIFYEDD